MLVFKEKYNKKLEDMKREIAVFLKEMEEKIKTLQ